MDRMFQKKNVFFCCNTIWMSYLKSLKVTKTLFYYDFLIAFLGYWILFSVSLAVITFYTLNAQMHNTCVLWLNKLLKQILYTLNVSSVFYSDDSLWIVSIRIERFSMQFWFDVNYRFQCENKNFCIGLCMFVWFSIVLVLLFFF